jgi:hypothetical protein
MRRPGRWIRTAAARLCARRTLERIIDPIVADIQTEHAEAWRAGRWWRAAWICVSGYAAFWRAVGLHAVRSGPRTLWSGIAADGWPLGRMIACSSIAFLSVTLLLAAPPIIAYSRHQSWLMLTLLDLPQVIPLSIPIALPLGIVCGMYGTRVEPRQIRGVMLLTIVATLVALAAMLSVPVADHAHRVALAEELDSRGRTYLLSRGPNAMSFSELAARSKEHTAYGSRHDARRFGRAYHMRFALPAATFVLSVLALGICTTLPGRARRFVTVVIALGLYWAALAFAETNTDLPPVLSAWAPNIMFAVLALILLEIFPDPPQAVL